jgi:cytoskeletal protein CcmA (bactofilin family)
MLRSSNRKDKNPREKTPNRKATPSIISADMNVLGNLITEGTVDIDGKLEGNVQCHAVNIRENGVIHGDIFAHRANIYGKIKGTIRAAEVYLHASCHVEGTVMHETLSVEDGAFIDGNLKRTDRVAPMELEYHVESDSETVVEEVDEEEDNIVELLETIQLVNKSKDS